MTDMQFSTLPNGRRVAFRHRPGADPALVFLPGYMSDMDGSKATAVLDWADQQNRGCLLLDYSGCGSSEGDFANGSLSRWQEEVLALIDARGIKRVTLIGSSMGGWLMLLVGAALGSRLAGMVGIAAAPDFSDWGFTAKQKAALAAGETIYEDNPYGPEPTPTHALFWQDAEALRHREGPIAIDCPVRLLHGRNDEDVPWQISLDLAGKLRSDDVQVTLIKSGDHRLSRDEDIDLLLRTLDSLPDSA